MGALEQFRHWRARIAARWCNWRTKRRLRHENFIITGQQATIASNLAAWETEVRSLYRQLEERQELFDKERRELTLQIELLTRQVEQLDAVVARDRARVEAEAAFEARRQQEYLNAPGAIIRK